MKKLQLIFFIAFATISITSCNLVGSNEGLKMTLNISFKNYLKSLTVNNDDSSFKTVLENMPDKMMPPKDFMDLFVKNYLQVKPKEKLFEVFSKNIELPIFKTENELQFFLLADYQQKIKKMDEVVKKRIYSFTGTAVDKIKIEHKDGQYNITIPELKDKNKLAAAFKNRGSLNFWEVVPANEIVMPVLEINKALSIMMPSAKSIKLKHTGDTSLEEMISIEQGKRTEKDPLFILINPTFTDSLSKGVAYWGTAKVKDTAAINVLLNKPYSKGLLKGEIQMLWGDLPYGSKEKGNKYVAIYAIKTKDNYRVHLDADDIKSAKFDYNNGNAEVSLEMNALGTTKFATLTKMCIGKPIAIEFGGYVLSAPNVLEAITEGRCSITGAFNAEEGSELANAINSGKFPLDFKIVSIEQYEVK